MLPISGPHLGRNAHRNITFRHIFEYHGVSADGDIVADTNIAKDFGACAYIHTVPNGGSAAHSRTPQPDGYAIANHDVVAHAGVPADNDAAEMFDHQAAANRCLTGQVDARQNLAGELENFVTERKRNAQDTWPDLVSPPAETIHHHHPQTLTGKVAFISAPVFANILKHKTSFHQG